MGVVTGQLEFAGAQIDGVLRCFAPKNCPTGRQKKTVPKSIVMLGDSPLAGGPGIGVRFTLSRTPDSYWSSWLVSLAGGCPIKEGLNKRCDCFVKKKSK